MLQHEPLGISTGTILVFVVEYPPDKPGVFWGFTKEDYDQAKAVWKKEKDHGTIH